MLERMRLMQTNRPCDVLLHWYEEGALVLNAPYQRGDVWGDLRRVNLIRSVLLGVPIPSIIINDRLRADWPGGDFSVVVIDGKQRITTLLKFLKSELSVPGEWFGRQNSVTFGNLNERQQRRFKNQPLAFSEGVLVSLEEEQEVFDLVNFGGVPQGESD